MNVHGRRRAGVVALAATMVFLGLPSPAGARDWRDYIRKWKSVDQPWRFTAGFPSGSGQRDRIRDGVRQWQNLGEPLTFTRKAEVAA